MNSSDVESTVRDIRRYLRVDKVFFCEIEIKPKSTLTRDEFEVVKIGVNHHHWRQDMSEKRDLTAMIGDPAYYQNGFSTRDRDVFLKAVETPQGSFEYDVAIAEKVPETDCVFHVRTETYKEGTKVRGNLIDCQRAAVMALISELAISKELGHLQSERSALVLQNNKLKGNVAELSNRLIGLKANYHTALGCSNANADECTKLREEVKVLRVKLKNLQGALNIANRQKREAVEDLAIMKANYHTALGRADECTKLRQRQREEVKALQISLSDLQGALDIADQQRRGAVEDLVGMKRRLADSNGHVVSLCSDYNALKKDLDAADEDLMRLTDLLKRKNVPPRQISANWNFDLFPFQKTFLSNVFTSY